MQAEKSSYIVNIIENTLNNMDERLVGHGKRVAYYVYKILKKQNVYTKKQIRDICLMAFIHDIGAYKTEEIHNLVAFETGDVWEHSIYGYLFTKHFSPLKHLAPVLLFHHADLKELEYMHLSYREITQIIFIADRIDVLSLSEIADWDTFIDSFYNLGGTVFDTALIDLFFRGEGAIAQEDLKLNYPPDFIETLYSNDFTPDEVTAYMRMIILTVEIGSPQTISGSFAIIKMCEIITDTTGFAEKFCELYSEKSYDEPLTKENVMSIMCEMKENGVIDSKFTDLVTECYDVLETGIDAATSTLDAVYKRVWEEYDLLHSMVYGFKNGLGDHEPYTKKPLAL